MERFLLKKIVEWRERSDRQPLVLQGARQVGKTWLVKEFARQHFEHLIYLNFEDDPKYRAWFEGSIHPDTLLSQFAVLLGRPLDAERDLIFFDEVQSCPRALTSLKYFEENRPEFCVIAAGSLLGVRVGKQSSFPVGKVQFLTLHPLNFPEFVHAAGHPYWSELLTNPDSEPHVLNAVHSNLLHLYYRYLFVGGMPRVVQKYVEEQNIEATRDVQRSVILSYYDDFSKYSTPENTLRVTQIWQSLPDQLARENKKFKFGDVQPRGRSITFELALNWLENAGLVRPVYTLSAGKIPLSGYADRSKFKLYHFDTGLLGALIKLDAKKILLPDALYCEYHGAFTENFVAQELTAAGVDQLYYWQLGNKGEVDFVFQNRNYDCIPLEVKSGQGRNTKGLRLFADKYAPDHRYRASPRPWRTDDDFTSIPIYAVGRLARSHQHQTSSSQNSTEEMPPNPPTL